jgi:hypothetical protein
MYGPYSEMITATTTYGYPVAPSDFTAIAEGDHIRLTWTDNTPEGSYGDEAAFGFMRATDGGVNYTLGFTVPGNTTSYIDYDVEPGVMYTYRIEAINEFGYGDYIFVSSATLEKEGSLVYPNPTNYETVTVNLDNSYVKGDVTVTIHSWEGYLYYVDTITLHGSKFTLDVFQTLPPNHYVMTLLLPDGTEVTTRVSNQPRSH